MNIMIIEDDAWIADLFKQIILKIRPRAQINWFECVSSARAAWQTTPCDFIISDWNLPGESGVSLIEEIRRQGSTVPIVIVTGRTDRESVMQVRRLRLSAFISKPFKVAKVIEQLEQLLPLDDGVAPVGAGPEPDFCTHLERLAPSELDLPLLDASQHLLEQHLRGEQLDLRQLIAQFQCDSALCARLIAVANSPLYNATGTPCISLNEALQLLGVNASLNLALALCLKRACQLRSGMLRLYAQEHLEQSERLCERVRQLALQLKLQSGPCQTAALLHRIGELCVLQQAQGWEDLGHSLSDNQVLAAMERFSGEFANALKVNWRLPMALREMIGAVYSLPPVNLKRDLILMRLAAVELSAEPEGFNRLRHLLGLPDAEPAIAPASQAL
jgi:HD-like signal output (HDOD) protein/FixJ family two-component response regulator